MKYGFYVLLLAFSPVSCRESTSAQRLSSEGSTAESVFLTLDNNQNPVVAWTERRPDNLVLSFSVSPDNGNPFPKKVSLTLSPDVATHAEGMPKIAFKKDGTIIAAYEKKAPTTENKYAGAICYMMSKDGGKTWTTEAFLHSDTISGRSRSYFDIERLPDGEIGASWLDIAPDKETGGRSVRFAKTTGSGGFANEILVDSSACQCCRIDVYTDSENIFVAYRGLKKARIGQQHFFLSLLRPGMDF